MRPLPLKDQSMPFDQLQAVGRALLAADWVFAKTMPQDPHEYTLRKTWKDHEFAATVLSMRKWGFEEFYGKRRCSGLLKVNGVKYWTMGSPLASTILINRKPATWSAPYDAIAPVYDQLFQDPVSRAEEDRVADLIGDDMAGRSILDVGCGTGAMLRYLRPHAYTGIDPSAEMVSRHREPMRQLIQCRLEEFVGGPFDAVLCLFGAANYINPTFIEAIPKLVRPGGSWFVMFYRPGYAPVTYERAGVTVPHWGGVHADLPGEELEVGNFVIRRGRADGTAGRIEAAPLAELEEEIP